MGLTNNLAGTLRDSTIPVDVSIVIVNWNTRELLRACLASLCAALASSRLKVEILVVDNASGDGSAEMVALEFPAVRCWANVENLNYAAGSNQALREAVGECVLLLNPDTEVPLGAIEALSRHLAENPAVGAVSPALVYPDGRLQDSVRGFPTPRALVGAFTGIGRLFPRSAWGGYRVQALPEDRPVAVDQPMASAFMVQRAVLEKIGHFDERFPLFFNDVDLCYRIRQAGWEIHYDPRVRVVHVGGASTRQVRPEAIRRSHAGLLAFYEKHYRGKLLPLLYTALVAAIRLSGRLRAALAARR